MARILFTDLLPATKYKAQFRATDGAAFSQWSVLFAFETINDIIPPSPPTNLQWVVSGSAFTATWDAPTTNSDGSSPLSDLKDYHVTVFSPAASTQRVSYLVTGTRFDFSFAMNLAAFGTPRPQVTIEVRARDEVGNLSDPVIATAQNPPPANVTSFFATGISDAVAFRWALVADDDIKAYRIRQGLSAGTVNLIVAEAGGTATTAVWDSIEQGLQYFSIVAVDIFNQESPTPANATATVRSTLAVDVTAPAAPSAVNYTNGADATGSYIDVAWVKPSDTDMQEYKIRYSTVSGGPWTYETVPAENPDGSAVQSFRIKNLPPATPYYVDIQSMDFQANSSAWVHDTGASKYPLTTSTDTTAPSQPAAPTVAIGNQPLTLRVTHNLQKQSGGVLESDTVKFKVYAGTTSGFTPSDSTNLVGEMIGITPLSSVFATAVITIPTAAATFVKVKAVDKNGNESTASPANSSAITPIYFDATYITDATITSAKINDLAANKIVAGTGLINDITVKSTLTLGDASTNGVVQSYDYVANGTTGWRIEKGAFTVNNGTIAARAIKLQNGSNIFHSAYADFEWGTSWYTGKITPTTGITWAIDTSQFKYGVASLAVTSDASNTGGVWLGSSATAYNVPVDAGSKVIVSAFARQNSGANKTVALYVKDSGGNVTNVTGNISIPSGAWTRISGSYTVAASVTAILVQPFLNDVSTTVYFDGFQVETQYTQETTPSQWKPPSATTIDGGQIITGSIQSNQPADGVSGQPAWSINTQGGMQVGNANVRGTLYVGPTGSNEAASSIRSGVYSAGNAGWKILGDGTAEFNQVTVRGNVYADNGYFKGDITGATGTFSGALSAATGSFAGSLSAASGTFTGTLSGATGSFSGTLSSPTINGGTITGAILTTVGSGTRWIISSNSYNVLLGVSNRGDENIPADIRVSEAAADRFIQMYSGQFSGGQRAHISVGGEVPGSASTEVDLVAPGGTIYLTGSNTNINTTSINLNATTNALRINNLAAGSSRALCLTSTDTIVQVSGSAERFKRGITPLDIPIDTLKSLRPVWYYWNTDLDYVYDEQESRHAGFIADEVTSLIPDAGFYGPDGQVEDFEDRAVLAGAYLLIKDLYAQVEELKAQLASIA